MCTVCVQVGTVLDLHGTESAHVQLQISPDGAIWTEDDLEREILPGALEVFTLNHFLRYVRLIYRSQVPNPLMVWFQAQC